MSIALGLIFTAMNAADVKFKLDTQPESASFRATLGRATPASPDTEWLVEQGGIPDLEGVEAFFRAQLPIHFPDVELPA